MMTLDQVRPTKLSWIKAMVLSGVISPLFSPFTWVFLFITIKASSNISEFLVGLLLAFNIALGIAWPVIISGFILLALIIYSNFTYWSKKSKGAWLLLGALVSTLVLFVALAIIGGLNNFINDIFVILEIFLNFTIAGALSALVFRRLLIKAVSKE